MVPPLFATMSSRLGIAARVIRAASRPEFLAELTGSIHWEIFLSFLHRHRVDEIPGKFSLFKCTTHTLTTPATIALEADFTAHCGFSLDDEEFNLGVRCIGAPSRRFRRSPPRNGQTPFCLQLSGAHW